MIVMFHTCNIKLCYVASRTEEQGQQDTVNNIRRLESIQLIIQHMEQDKCGNASITTWGMDANQTNDKTFVSNVAIVILSQVCHSFSPT